MPRQQLEKTYDPEQVEERWYQFWTTKGYFHASVNSQAPPYSIVIPPPNVTGSLHIGHALNNSLQDILIRWRRMQGRNTLWMPGTDHAGIATQIVVERQLIAEGTTREALGRQKFVERVWEWKAEYGDIIVQQLKRLGASCDWDRLRFTMDEGLSRAVREVFVRLHEDGLIYRGKRLINWCPRCLTALSDIEVEHEEIQGKLYHIRYPLADDPSIVLLVATTRPETMLGDTAVAVHPEDPRYNRLIGRKVSLPLTHRQIPVVGDPILVDREFGTGAVKITPAHDFNDFEAGERHRLPRVAIFNEHAQLSPTGLQNAEVEEGVRGRLVMLSVPAARALVVQELEARGFLAGVEPHKMALGKCYRCKTVVEPYLSPQWFVKIKPLAEPAVKAVEDGRIRLIPESWTNNYLGWLRDIKDWCISRQIWWGHQIPAWYCRNCHADLLHATKPDGTVIIPPEAKPIVARTTPAHCPDCSMGDFIRDPDVLDTWFSSALWPFSTLGWPEQTPELKVFYPTSTLVTGLDILFFWVARMVMMGLKFTGQVPFRDVYIHALVRDVEGQKMSKSKGNVIDPLSVMDRYGTDALRFTLASMASPGRDIKLATERIEGYRNFANKIWNAARFILINLEGPRSEAPLRERSLTDRWITSRLHRCIDSVNRHLDLYRFDEAANALYQFIWHEYCDWYLELSKPALADKGSAQAAHTRATLVETFETLLRLLHPFMPFLTEEIWQALPHTGDSIMVAPYPTANEAAFDDAIEREIGDVQKVITGMRDGRSVQGIPPSMKLQGVIRAAEDEARQLVEKHRDTIIKQAGLSNLTVGDMAIKYPVHAIIGSLVLSHGQLIEFSIALPAGTMEAAKERSKSRKEKRLSELAAQIEQDQKKLSNPDFVSKAPPEVLEKTRKRLEESRLEHEKLSQELQLLRAQP
ncbi:MAG: valine--tRNA ligase [Nitrospirae bacterium]|nr:valine--tRNA ligase [Nitrospirota bacterium]